MRIALIGPVPPRFGGQTPGGVATHTVQLAEGLARAGADVALLATNASGETSGTGETPPFPMYRMTRPPFGLGAVKYLARVGRTRRFGSRREVLTNVLAYARFVETVRPDVIHVQHPLERCTYARMVREADHVRAPLVVTAHSLFGEHADATIRGLMAPNLRAADRVIAVSEHIADQAVQLGVERARIRVVHSGVDANRFQPRDRPSARARLGLCERARVVLFVGNLEPRKQLDVLLRAIPEVRTCASEVELLVVGSGESAGADDQTAYLQRLAGELRIADSVRFVGRLPDERLLDAYAAADVFALPSSSEAQGIVALEAMACGLPVIASAVGGLLGTIEDGATGCLVPARDVQALASRIQQLLCDDARRQAMGEAARRSVEQRFTWSAAVAATLEVYREALDCA